MKKFELDWVGPVPPQWHRQPLKALFHQHKEKNKGLVETNLLSLSYGRIVRRDINQRGGLLPESFESYNIVSDGDIVLRLTDLQNDQKSLRTGQVREKGIITSAYITLRANHAINTDYFQALLESYDYKKVFYSMGGGVRQGLNYNDISSLPLLVPPASEQDSIAEFIYNKKTEVDGLVEKLQREVQLLERYRRELIAHTVTRGLNPDVPMKDSGIEWIGVGPANWTPVSAKAIFVRRTEFERGGDVHLTPSQMFGVLPQEEFIAVSGVKPTLKLSDSGKMKHVEPGDFIIHLRSFQGGLEYSEYRGKVSAAYTVITPRNNQLVDRGFFRWLFKSTPFVTNLASLTNQLRDGQSINFKTFSKTSYLLPSLVEQQAIAAFLNRKTEEIDSAIEGINRQIELLGKYRKQVVNDAVTGKIRVGEVA